MVEVDETGAGVHPVHLTQDDARVGMTGDREQGRHE
jgi:hypothetical protein